MHDGQARDMAGGVTRATGGGRGGWTLMAALLAYLAVLTLLRPASPFEWDEVLFLEGVEHYDVGVHHPHPPGYPAYVGAAKALRLVVADPLLALQLVSVLSAGVALLALWRLARRLGAPPAAATAGAALLAVTPAFAFNANVGLSDVAGTAGAVGAVWAMVVALDAPAYLPLASAASAVALAVRPQLVVALLPVGLYVIWDFVRRRRLRLLGLGLASGVVASVACWLPALLATGVGRYFETTRSLARWMEKVERGYRLPGAPLGDAASYWFVRPFGPWPAAAVFWVLVAWGCWEWWRRGNRRLLAVAGASAASYLAIALFTLNFTTSVRYVLPALPFLGVLAAGVVVSRRRLARASGWALAVAWCLGVVAWAAPVYHLRRQPAPVWAAMEWVRGHLEPTTTTVVYPGGFGPHVKYLLSRAGFSTARGDNVPPCASALRANGDVVVLLDHAAPPGRAVFSASWQSERLRALTRDRYYRAEVVRLPVIPGPCVSEGWRESPHGWSLSGQGLIEIGESEVPRTVRVRAGSEALLLRRAGFAPLLVPAAGEALLPLFPGPAGGVGVRPASLRGTAVIDSVELVPFRPDDAGLAGAVVVAQVAHVAGEGASEWHSDVTIFNPHGSAEKLRVRFFPAAGTLGTVQSVDLSIPGGAMITVPDVLGGKQWPLRGSAGFLLIESRGGGGNLTSGTFVVFSRTRNLEAGGDGVRVGEGLPGAPLGAALVAGGEVHFSGVSNDPKVRTNIGVVSLAPAPATVRFEVASAAGASIASEDVVVPPMTSVQRRLETQISSGSLRVELVAGPGGAKLFPYITMIDNATGMPDHRLPDELAGPSPSPSGARPGDRNARP